VTYSREQSRAVSTEAFQEILDSTLLTDQQRLALYWVRRLQPVTAREIEHHSERRGLWKRLSELADLGVIAPTGTRKCRVSGMKAQEWVITGLRPIESKRARRRASRRAKAVAFLEGALRAGGDSITLHSDTVRWLVEALKA
jgi:hypothetical protein